MSPLKCYFKSDDLGSDDAFIDSLAQHVQKLWPFKSLPATVVATTGILQQHSFRHCS